MIGGVQLVVISEMPVEAKKKRLAVCTVIWGVHGTRGMILAMPVNGPSHRLSLPCRCVCDFRFAPGAG